MNTDKSEIIIACTVVLSFATSTFGHVNDSLHVHKMPTHIHMQIHITDISKCCVNRIHAKTPCTSRKLEKPLTHSSQASPVGEAAHENNRNAFDLGKIGRRDEIWVNHPVLMHPIERGSAGTQIEQKRNLKNKDWHFSFECRQKRQRL